MGSNEPGTSGADYGPICVIRCEFYFMSETRTNGVAEEIFHILYLKALYIGSA